MEWVEVPAGRLLRGTPCEDVPQIASGLARFGVQREWLLKECPRSEVIVPGFRIARTPITNSLWGAFEEATGTSIGVRGPSDHPVSGVRWEQAQAFCAWLSDQLGGTIRLPSEDEWERAARADDAREYPWGDEYRTGLANLRDLGVGGTTPVGSFPAGASPFGVLDMAGNVDEWTATEYQPYPGAPEEVPPRESWAADPHVTRGGCWLHNRDLARCARRHGVYDAGFEGVGLRVAADL